MKTTAIKNGQTVTLHGEHDGEILQQAKAQGCESVMLYGSTVQVKK